MPVPRISVAALVASEADWAAVTLNPMGWDNDVRVFGVVLKRKEELWLSRLAEKDRER